VSVLINVGRAEAARQKPVQGLYPVLEERTHKCRQGRSQCSGCTLSWKSVLINAGRAEAGAGFVLFLAGHLHLPEGYGLRKCAAAQKRYAPPLQV